VRACSVVRSPPRASNTANAVPNDPAPITVARLAPGVGSERTREARTAGLTAVVTFADAAALAGVTVSGVPGVAVGSGSVI